MSEAKKATAHYHLPGLFEFYDFYRVFLPLYRTHREYFYDWCEIASIYGAPEGCLWGGVGCGNQDPHAVLALTQEYGLSARLTFSNSLLTKAYLADSVCNALCRLFSEADGPQNGVIIHSDLLLDYLRAAYPQFYFISSTTKVLTDFPQLRQELEREAFRFVVPDFRLNKAFDQLLTLPQPLKGKVEFLCNECCWFGCKDRKACYEAVSRRNLGINGPEHRCTARDMALILRSAMENELCREVLTAKRYHTAATEFHPQGQDLSNWFLRRIEDKDCGNAEVLAAKTGYVAESGSCAASYAQDADGRGYLCVTGNAHSAWRAIYDHAALYAQYVP